MLTRSLESLDSSQLPLSLITHLYDLHSVESFDFDFVRVESFDGVFAPSRVVEKVEDVRRPVIDDVVFGIASVRIPTHRQSHCVRGVTSAKGRGVTVIWLVSASLPLPLPPPFLSPALPSLPIARICPSKK